MKKDNLENIFSDAAATNKWGDLDSLSGKGSNLLQTKVIRKEIPLLIKKFKIRSVLDAPCGDFFWMSHVIDELIRNMDSYKGVDLVLELIIANRKKYAFQKLNFEKLNLIDDEIPKVDLIITRDCFIHLSFSNIFKVLKNYQKSQSSYLLLSTYTNSKRINIDIDSTGLHFRALNMQKAPFFFPSPIALINEGCTEEDNQYTDKSLALWKIDELKLNSIRYNILLYSIWSFFLRGVRKTKRIFAS